MVLPKNLLDYPIWCNWLFDNYQLAQELFAKSLQSLQTCQLVNNNLCGRLFSWLESPAKFYESLKVTSVPLFILDFNLLSWKLDSCAFKMLYWVILYWYYFKAK